jgi:hypothetical protein
MFSSLVFCLDLSSSAPYKYKKNVIDLITSNGGIVSFVLNKKVDYLVRSDMSSHESYKCRMAFKLHIPVVSVLFVFDSVRNGSLLTDLLKEYLLENRESLEGMKKGKVLSSE